MSSHSRKTGSHSSRKCGSDHSSISSARLRAAATLARLAAEAENMEKLKAIEEEELRVRQRKRDCALQLEIAKADAEEKVLEEFEEQSSFKGLQELFAESTADEMVGKWLADSPHEVPPAELAHPEQFVKPVQVPSAQEVSIPVQPTIPSLQREMIDTMQLPKCELTKFDGEPLKYWMFIKSFDATVGNTSVGPNVKLNRLFYYCEGEALAVIQCCAVMEPQEGYTKARELLRERFGNDYKITETWVQRLTEGPRVMPGDKKAIQKLADDLRSCTVALTAMGKLEEIDTKRSLGAIVRRLPQVLQSKWRSKAVTILDDTGRYPGINKLVDFLDKSAREANDPVYGFKDNNKDRPVVKKVSNFSVQATGTPRPKDKKPLKHASKPDAEGSTRQTTCPCCSGNHLIDQCSSFAKMSPSARLKIARERKLCFNCLSGKRHFSRKCDQGPCGVQGCNGRHSKLLHEAFQSNKGSEGTSDPTTPSNQDVGATSYACGGMQMPAKIALPIVAVMVKGSDQEDWLKTYALLDPGSNRSFCSVNLAKSLNLHGSKQSMHLNTLSNRSQVESLMVSLDVTAVAKTQESKIFHLPKVHALKDFPVLCDSLAGYDETQRFTHLKGIPIPQVSKEVVMLLIGQDAPHLLAPLEVRHGRQGEPYAVRSVLGWTISGPLSDGTPPQVTSHFVQGTLEAQVERFWKLDLGDMALCDSPSLSVNDKRALKIWDDSVKIVDGHYQLAIPFRADDPNLPDNKALAVKRLTQLGRRLSKDGGLHDRYSTEVNNLLAKGFAEKVPEDELDGPPGRTWYIPHHGVLNPNKPGKLRVVFDCAARCKGRALNDVVLQGPDLTNKLIGVLLRFRVGRIALMADIEQMFHQVGVTQEHRDALRFVWWHNGDMNACLEVFRMKVHLFGGVWSPSCANYALLRAADDFGDQFVPEVASTVRNNFYVDDCLKSVETVEGAIQLSKQLSELLALGGFRLTKWISNSRRVLETIPLGERAKVVKDMDLDSERLPVERALGVSWDTEDDTLAITTRPKLKAHTRRGLLSVVCSVYDPLGFVCPFVLRAKILFQDECRLKGKSWDDPLEVHTQEKWMKWLDDIPKLSEFKVDRCLIPDGFGDVHEVQLHHFADASKDAFGCVSYARFVSVAGEVHCTFLLGKSRLAPLKTMTIPRLELSAAVVAARVDLMLRKEIGLGVSGSTFWTDSVLVLQYIRNETKRFHTFVANRVAVIHDVSVPEQWRYVGTAVNPADDASRGLDASQMVSSDRWRKGPEFLWKSEEEWPVMPEVPNLDKDKEVKSEATSQAVDAEEKVDTISELVHRYSSWLPLRKAVAWILRFKSWLKDRKPKCGASRLTVGELKEAESAIIKFVQREGFRQEIKDLSGGQSSVRKQSSIYSLRPYLDNSGLLRLGGRLRLAPIEEDSKFPAILPKNHHVSDLIVRHVHESLAGHSGKDHVLSVLRRKYWIPQPRPVISRVLKGCMLCKRLHGRPQVQLMADLPEGRVTPGKPPFSYVGVDCFGPFCVKRGRCREKRYGCLFTCLATRGIHLETLHSMEADSFLNCLVRFTARRGTPECLYSDNGSNFVGGERELREALSMLHKDNKVNGALLVKHIDWRFNPPLASHMGGAWERQIRTVRKVLASLLHNEVLDDERLETLFCEVESIVNDRPLTHVSDDPNDLGALTPSHLLKFRPGHPVPLHGLKETDRFRKRWKHVQLLAERFWKRWISEYLPNLQRRQRWVEGKRNLSVGDLVLVRDDNTPRGQWPLGRISKTFPGSDGLVRSVEVRTASGCYVRPITKLCLLEGAHG